MRILHHAVLSVCGFFLLTAVHASGQVNSMAISPAEQYLQVAADRERAALDLPPLRRDAALVTAARTHALQMVAHGAISHQFGGEPELAARGAAAGAHFSLISENVAVSSTAIRIHDAWMHSEGHRHNLLDTNVDAVGIAVVAHGSRLYAVEDFERTVETLPLKEQESKVAAVVAAKGIEVDGADDYARRSCSGATESEQGRRPSFVMRYTTANLERIPEELQTQIEKGKYARAVVAACSTDTGEFSMYSIAVLLYRGRVN
jgi:hypothetical protein